MQFMQFLYELMKLDFGHNLYEPMKLSKFVMITFPFNAKFLKRLNQNVHYQHMFSWEYYVICFVIFDKPFPYNGTLVYKVTKSLLKLIDNTLHNL